MPDNDDKKPSDDCREAKAGWLYQAKGFLMRGCGMYDVGDNANLKLSENNIKADTVVIVDRLIMGRSNIDEGEANGLYDNYHR
jgi:hypothetical protein